MLELEKGTEILADIGGIDNVDEAWSLFREKMSEAELAKLEKITTEGALLKIANSIALCQPDSVMINSGNDADRVTIRKMSIDKGEEKPLAMKDHTIHFDLAEEQGRIVDRTFYIVNPDEKISALAKKILRDEGHEYVKDNLSGVMAGKVMLVGFFNRGPAGAPATIPALEITSSTYVMHSANLLYRNSYDSFDQQVKDTGFFFTNLHSEGPWRAEDLPKARVFMDRSWLTTYSMYCTYAGNTLLMKKGNHRFAVDLATYFHPGKQLSEHMFITGFDGPGGRSTFFCGAAPSGCGKTTTAMAGDRFVGDDLAQMWIAEDGTMRAVNPEKGIFGIVEDVNWEGDPYLMKCLREEWTEVIFSNVLIDDQMVPHWVGSGEEHPPKGHNFMGEWWEGKTDDNGKPIPISHPNARATVPNEALTDKPILAGLNYFLTAGARGGEGTRLLGEKRDVKVWLNWLERRSHNDIDAIATPIGFIPKYDDLKELFDEKISKEYPRDLYDTQFSLYVDKILARIDLQEEAYGKEDNVPQQLFEVYDEQRKGLDALKEKYGSVVTPAQLEEAAG
ncbi:MAG: phosphoenolpyruvate carboxykinase (GTP) [Acidobacteria bacterium]|nr:phosphoenolpyruvate carboxykinase (GTP) [Candidatus Sulfomarinibacter kjeldsenii]